MPSSPNAVLQDMPEGLDDRRVAVAADLAAVVDQLVAVRQRQRLVGAGTSVLGFGDHARRERGRARDDLEGRAGRIGLLDGPVQQRLRRVRAAAGCRSCSSCVPSKVVSSFGLNVGYDASARMAPVLGLDRHRRGRVAAVGCQRLVGGVLRGRADGQLDGRALLLLAGQQAVKLCTASRGSVPGEQAVLGLLDAGLAVDRVVAGDRRVDLALRVVALVDVGALDQLRLGDLEVGAVAVGEDRAALVGELLVEDPDVAAARWRAWWSRTPARS